MSASEPPKRLENWKQIAAYLGKSISAAQRWEKEEGLPVHRHEHQALASVFAFPEELDKWLESRKKGPKATPQELLPSTASPQQVMEEPPPTSRDWTRRAWLGAGVVAAGLATAALLRPRQTASPVRPLFFGSAKERTPSVSADGRFILYIEGDGESTKVRLFDRRDGSNRVLETLPVSSWACECRLSPNAKMLAFLTLAPGNLWDVNVRDVAGGPVRTIARLDGVGLDWAPDSATLVMTTPPEHGGPLCAWSVHHLSRDKRRISKPPAGYWGDIEVAASPDGVHLATIRYAARGDGDVWLLSWDGRVERRLTGLHTWINGLTFTPDGQEIVFAPVGTNVGGLQRVGINGASPEEIATPGAAGVACPKAGKGVLVFNTRRLMSRIYRARRDGNSLADVRLTIPITAEGEHIAFSPDGRSFGWVQEHEIWASDDGASPRRIAEVPFDKRELAWSPDRQHLAITVKKGQQWRIWIVDAATGSMKRLTRDEAVEGRAVWPASGKYIYWRSERAGDARYFRMRWPEGGATEPVSGAAAKGLPSTDDRRFYYLENDQKSMLKEIDIGSGNPARSLSHIPPIEPGHFFVRGSTIVYALRRARSDRMPVYEAEIAGGAPRLLFEFPEPPEHVTDLAIRPDLSEAAWTKTDDQNDIWIHEEFL